MSEYCCEEVKRRVGVWERDVEIAVDGSLTLNGLDSFPLHTNLPYCPWCGTKLLKEKEDG